MPTYEYECRKCKRVFEIRQRISEPPLKVCDVCGGEVRRLLSAAPFILKGAGWYVTDYPSESRKKALQSEKSSDSASAKSGETKSGETKSGETKSGETKSGEKTSDKASDKPADKTPDKPAPKTGEATTPSASPPATSSG